MYIGYTYVINLCMCVAIVDNVLLVEPAESNDSPETCINGLQGICTSYMYVTVSARTNHVCTKTEI